MKYVGKRTYSIATAHFHRSTALITVGWRVVDVAGYRNVQRIKKPDLAQSLSTRGTHSVNFVKSAMVRML